MHTFTAKNGTLFNSNSDLSGRVVINVPHELDACEVDSDDLLEFVAYHVRQRRIAIIEEQTVDQAFGIAEIGNFPE